MFPIFRRKKREDPADYVFRRGHIPGGCYLFDDGTFGTIADPKFDITEFLDEFFDSYLHYSVSQRLFEDRCRQLTECRGSEKT